MVRRALLRRKYGGEKASRGLAGRRRAAAEGLEGEVDTGEGTMNSNAREPGEIESQSQANPP